MTLDELVDKTADELEKMTDAELRAWFAPYEKVTRPEFAQRVAKKQSEPVDYKMQAKLQQLAALGLDLTGMLPRKKK